MDLKTCPCVLSLACLTGRISHLDSRVPRQHLNASYSCPRCHLTARLLGRVYVRVPCPVSKPSTRVCVFCDNTPRPLFYDLTTEKGVALLHESLKRRRTRATK